MIFTFAIKIKLVLQLIPQILVGSNLTNQFAITVYFNFKWFTVFKWFSLSSGSVFQGSKLVDFLKYIYLFIKQYLVTWKESCFLYFSIIQFKFVFSYPQYILHLKIITKTYQSIYCFSSGFLAVAVMVTYTFSLTRKIIYLFNLFVTLISF